MTRRTAGCSSAHEPSCTSGSPAGWSRSPAPGRPSTRRSSAITSSRSCRSRLDLGPLDDAGRAVAGDASRHLAVGRPPSPRPKRHAGREQSPRASRGGARPRGPVPAGAGRPISAEALIHERRVRPAPTPTSSTLLDAASKSGDERLHAVARIVRRCTAVTCTDPEGFSEAALGVAGDAIAVLERARRPHRPVQGLAADRIRARDAVPVRAGRGGGCATRWTRHGKRATGDTSLRTSPSYALSAAYGPMPVPEAIRRCRHVFDECAGSQGGEALALCALVPSARARGLSSTRRGRCYRAGSRAVRRASASRYTPHWCHSTRGRSRCWRATPSRLSASSAATTTR